MTVYKIFDDGQHYQNFHLEIESFLDLLDPSIGETAAMQFGQKNIALEANWEPLTISLRENDGSENKLPDICLWRGASMILSRNALSVLRPILSDLGELLPVKFNDEEYALFNCLVEVSADESKSVRVEEDGFFMDVDSLEFPSDTRAPIFKSPFENNRNLFCTDEFKKMVEEKDFGGIYFGQNLVDFS